ncbi:MAG: TM0996/MTH895 family glutaredoxin-like protein [Chloroflexi bacterium]|nr:TM0996/MTH895 family glutaredoxin-like protein [Chloroflexota bacterium]
MKLEVFGIGCPKCQATEKNAAEALRQLGLEGEVKLVKDQLQIIKKGIISTPALAINGDVKAMGRIPQVKEIVNWLSEKR